MELSSKLSVSFFFFLFALIANAQDSPQDFVNAHNEARSQVGVPNITWDNIVAAYAQYYASYASQRKPDCQLVHSTTQYGENLAWSSGNMSAAAAVKLWVDEKAYYDYNSNSCATGQECGHYTQVVWKDSIHLGCAIVSCGNGGTLIVCDYDPPGNYIGQRPFTRYATENLVCSFISSEGPTLREALE